MKRRMIVSFIASMLLAGSAFASAEESPEPTGFDALVAWVMCGLGDDAYCSFTINNPVIINR